MKPATTLEVFFSERVSQSGECWIVSGAAKHHGYKQVVVRGVRHAVHRWVYEQMVAPIPTGLEIDHLCRNTSCVNPDHLEPVTRAENARRMALSECARGHDLTQPESRYATKNRACKACARERAGKQADRRRVLREAS